jgi:polyhydroxyalkanoate synthesis regulator phasin
LEELIEFYCRVLTISKVLEYLVQHGKITDEIAKSVQVFIRENQTQLPGLKPEIENKSISIPIRKRFQTIMKEKKTNLCLSADLTSLDEIIEVKFFGKSFIKCSHHFS